MIQPDTLPQPNYEPAEDVNRILATAALYDSVYFAPLVVPEGYTPDDDITRTELHKAYDRDQMPRQLNKEEARLLGIYISIQSDPKGKASARERLRTEVRTLHWLGSISTMYGDMTTSRSVAYTLWHKHGLAGKRAAVSLWYERAIQN